MRSHATALEFVTVMEFMLLEATCAEADFPTLWITTANQSSAGVDMGEAGEQHGYGLCFLLSFAVKPKAALKNPFTK